MKNINKSLTAPMSLSIRIITSVVIILMIGLFIFAIFDHSLLIPAIILFITTFFCWVFSPASYEIKDNDLIIHFNGYKKVYPSLKSVKALEKPFGYWGVRIGNGGLFCGAGIFWTKQLGFFRAYVTRASYKDMVLVETEKYKLLITPEEPDKFLKEE